MEGAGELALAADAIGGDPGRVLTVFNNNGSFLLALFEFFIFFAWFMCLWWVFGDLFRSRDLGGGAKTLWTLFIIILPILGMLVYLIARGRGMTDRSLEAQAEMQKRQETYIRSVAASNGGTGSTADQIKSAKSLLDSGAINQSEYEQLKAKALATSGA
jgi:ABC-type multidrug transport system fused ATPase/permease subunit